MKRTKCFSLLLLLLFLLNGCGAAGQVTLQDRSPVPEDGLLSAAVLEKLRDENAIAVFEGTSGGLTYEWTIFGSDIETAAEIDLRVDLAAEGDGLRVSFAGDEPFGFPALLSVRLNEKWAADTAKAWQGEEAVCPVSLTGTKTTILNLSVSEPAGALLIRPETITEDAAAPGAEAEQESGGREETKADDYLSQTKQEDVTVYDNSGAEVTETPQQQDDYLSSSKNTAGTLQTGTTQLVQQQNTQETEKAAEKDTYLSGVKDTTGRVYSDGTGSGKDQYLTDPVPEGKPMPVEPEDQQINDGKTYTCTFSIECSTILNNLEQLEPEKLEMVPSGGVILAEQTVTFYEGESVFDVLQRVCRENGIHLESSWTPIYNTAYIEGIHNLYEFDCGELSGWMYRVNGWYPNYGCSRYRLADGDTVEWRYTCNDLGKDIGRNGDW